LGHQTALTFSVLIPILTTEWRLSAGQAGVILGGFQFGTLAAYVIVGVLLDRMKSKPIMAWSAALVGVGDLLFAFGARDFASGLLLRLLVGILIGGLYLPALKQIAETIPAARRGTATGIYMATLVTPTPRHCSISGCSHRSSDGVPSWWESASSNSLGPSSSPGRCRASRSRRWPDQLRSPRMSLMC